MHHVLDYKQLHLLSMISTQKWANPSEQMRKFVYMYVCEDEWPMLENMVKQLHKYAASTNVYLHVHATTHYPSS